MTAFRSLLNDRSLQFPSSNPLILIAFDQNQINDLQSLLENKSLSLSHSGLAAGSGLVPAQKRMPITEVIFICNLEESQSLISLLKNGDDSRLLSDDSPQTGLVLSSSPGDSHQHQLAIVRITPEKFVTLIEQAENYPNLSFLWLLRAFFMLCSHRKALQAET